MQALRARLQRARITTQPTLAASLLICVSLRVANLRETTPIARKPQGTTGGFGGSETSEWSTVNASRLWTATTDRQEELQIQRLRDRLFASSPTLPRLNYKFFDFPRAMKCASVIACRNSKYTMRTMDSAPDHEKAARLRWSMSELPGCLGCSSLPLKPGELLGWQAG